MLKLYRQHIIFFCVGAVIPSCIYYNRRYKSRRCSVAGCCSVALGIVVVVSSIRFS